MLEAILFSAFVIYAALSDAVKSWTKDWNIIVYLLFTYVTCLYRHESVSMASVVFTDLDIRCRARLLALKQVFENTTLIGKRPSPLTCEERACKFKRQAWNLLTFLGYAYSAGSTEHVLYVRFTRVRLRDLTLILLTWRIWWSNNASKWQMRFNSSFKGLKNTHSSTTI